MPLKIGIHLVNIFSEPLLFFKGFKALQSHRVASWLWSEERHTLAHFIQSRASEVYGIDIHPAAEIGKGSNDRSWFRCSNRRDRRGRR